MSTSIVRLWIAMCSGSVLAMGVAQAQFQETTPYDSLPSLTAHLSLTTAHQLQLKGSVFAYVTRDSLHLGVLEVSYPVTTCFRAFPRISGSKSFPLPGRLPSVPPPFALLAADGVASIRAVVAVILQGTVIRQVVTGTPGNLVLARTDSTRLENLEPGQVVNAVAASQDAGASADSSLVVAGSPGFLAWIEWKDGRFGLQKPLPPAEEDFLRFGGGWFGGAGGGVFRIGSSEAQIRFRDTPPDLLDSGMVLWNGGGTGGLLALFHEGSWTRFDVPPGEYRAVRLRRHLQGVEARLYPTSGPPTIAALGDRPVAMAAAYPSGTPIAVGGTLPIPVVPGPLPDTLTVTLSDPDYNYSGVEAMLARTDGRIDRLGPFVPSDGNGKCASPGLCLPAGAARLEFAIGRDSVRAWAKVRVTRFYGGATGCVTRNDSDGEAAFALAWSVGDTVRVRVGGREVALRKVAGVGIADRSRHAGEAEPFVLSRNRIFDSWPAWTGIGRDWIASVHGADGRSLGYLGPGTDLRALPAGLVFLRWREAANGRPMRVGQSARLPDRVLLH